MKNNLVQKIESKISEIKSDSTRSLSKGQLDLLVNTNASTLENFLEDVTFVVKHQ